MRFDFTHLVVQGRNHRQRDARGGRRRRRQGRIARRARVAQDAVPIWQPGEALELER